MRRLIFAVLLLAVAAAWMGARADVNKMNVVMRDGQRITYTLLEDPQITIAGGNLVVQVGGRVYNHPIDQLQRYELEAVNSGIDQIADDTVPSAAQDGDIVTLSNLAPDTPVMLYTVDGRLAINASAGADGSAAIDLSALPAGVYVLRANQLSTKIIKR